MAIETVFRDFLLQSAAINGLVGTRVFQDRAPQNATYPLIVIRKRDVTPTDDHGYLAEHVETTWRILGETQNFPDLVTLRDGLRGLAGFALPEAVAVGRSLAFIPTNDWTFSEEIDNAVWGGGDFTLTPDATKAPDGLLTGDQMLETAVSNPSHGFQRAWTDSTPSTPQTVSLFLKPSGRDWTKLQSVDRDVTVRNSWVNVLTGTLGTSDAGHTVTITPVGLGWFRVTITFDSGAAGAGVSFGVNTADQDNSGNFLGDITKGLFVWGLQLETDKANASDYIPTAATTENGTEIQSVIQVFESDQFNENSQLFAVIVDFNVMHTEFVLPGIV